MGVEIASAKSYFAGLIQLSVSTQSYAVIYVLSL